MKYKIIPITPCRYYDAKIFRYPQDRESPDYSLRWHYDYEFIYIIKGRLKLSLHGKSVILGKNELYFLNSQEIHSYDDCSDDAEFVIMTFSPKAIRPYLDDPYIIPSFRNPEGVAKDMIIKSLSAISDYPNPEDKLTSMRIRAILFNVLYYLIRDCMSDDISYVKGSESDDFDCARSAIAYIAANYQKDITLNDISHYVGMTPAHFSKYFKDKTSETFSKYLRRIRLEHAIEDIVNDGSTVKAAAENNGFPNVNSLIGTCKAEYGYTPVEIKNFRVI